MQNILTSDAASGIGVVSARLFHHRGWRVGLLDVDAEVLHGLAMQLSGAWQHAVDVSEPDTVSEAFARFCVGSRLCLLFNCAGVLCFSRFEEAVLEDHTRLLTISLQGVPNYCYAAFPPLCATPQVQVLSMGSASGLYSASGMVVYSTLKFAMHGLIEALELEWRRHGIHVADLMPPFVHALMVVGQTYRPPVLRRPGLRLDVEDTTKTVWRQAYSRRVYQPVGGLFTALYQVGQLFPPWVNRAVMAWLSRDEQVPVLIRRLSGVLADIACGGIRPTGPGNVDCRSSSVGRMTAYGYPPFVCDISG